MELVDGKWKSQKTGGESEDADKTRYTEPRERGSRRVIEE